jgi:murein DD-endopeptidase MepM/ murein hydrolase activator NlpD
MWNSIVNLLLITGVVSLLSGTHAYGKEAEGATITSYLVKPSPSLVVSPQRTYPGDAILIRSKQAQSVTLFQKTYPLQLLGGEYVRFIPIPFDTRPGQYVVQSTDKKWRTAVTVSPKKFAVDSITVSNQMNSMRQNTARIAADQKKINLARSQSAKTPYFQDPFLWPAQGRLTTPYGYQRVVNGKPANRHTAIDIANKEGTPIVSSNHGKVALADTLYLTGNTVIIDHGLNLFSIYAHMSKMDVKPGQLVKRGQLIGKIGTTGFSTGPHLHYGMLIGNTYINPAPFFESSPLLWK